MNKKINYLKGNSRDFSKFIIVVRCKESNSEKFDKKLAESALFTAAVVGTRHLKCLMPLKPHSKLMHGIVMDLLADAPDLVLLCV